MAKKKEKTDEVKVNEEPAKEEMAEKKAPKALKEKKAKAPKKEKVEEKAEPVETAPEKAEKKPEEMIVEAAKEEAPKKEEPQRPFKKGIVKIYSSGNNTIIHITDVTGAETIARVSGGMVTKQDRLKGAPFQAMLAAAKAIEAAEAQGLTDIDILVRAPGGHRDMDIGKGAEQAIKAFSKSRLKISVVEDVTPIIHGRMRRKGGRRGRRL